MNIYERIKAVNAQNMDKPALSIATEGDPGSSYTYFAMFSHIEIFADSLLTAGVTAGDRIAIVAENCPEWPIAYLALAKIRATSVLIDASLPAAEIKQLVDTADVSLILTTPTLVKRLDMNPKQPLLNVLDIESAFDGFASRIDDDYEPLISRDESIANIIYSSGTTRSAAGIMHTHDSMLCSTQMCLDQINMRADERFLGILPCSHIYGIITTLIAPLLLGSEVRYVEALTAELILATFADYRPTIFPAVPKMLDLFRTQILRKIESDKKTKLLFNTFFPVCCFLKRKFGIDLGKKLFKDIGNGFGGALDIICSAGAPLDKETAEFYYGCGITLLITYGATETNIPTIGNLRHNLTNDTCGTPYPDVEVKVNDSGEIIIRSPYMMKGYFGDEEATANAFEDGWFLTGDLGFVDETGRYRVTGRSKDNLVLSTGKKVTPDDIEAQYGAIPGAAEFVVCGVPCATGSGDEAHAFVVLEPNGSREAVTRALREIGESLSSSMKIMQTHFVDSIPRTSLQKPKRYLLKRSLTETSPASPVGEETEPVNVEERIISLISSLSKTDKSLLSGQTRPFSQLGIDSLSAIELVLQLEDVFNVRFDDTLPREISIVEICRIVEHKKGQSAPVSETKGGVLSYPMNKLMSDYQLFRNFCRFARLFYKISVKGESKIPSDSGYIICANHLSNFDYLWLCINFEKDRFNKFCCMAKKELFNGSFLSNRLARVCGMIPVDRGNVNSGLMARCKDMLHEKWGLLIYPEGTRSNDGNLGTLKNGAAQLALDSNVPIVPAFIKGAREIYPKEKKLPRLFNFSKMERYPVVVVYGEPIYPRNLSVEQLTKLVEESMLSLSYAK